MLVKFIMIPSLEKLITIVSKSKGKVYLQLSEDVCLDLKVENNLYELLEQQAREKKGIMIHVYDKDDYLKLVDFMVGANYD